ncbi:MAG: hypothetical protein Q9218_001252 [Villophora microphyllina]
MLFHAMLALKVLGAFNAVPLAQPREIFCWFGAFVLSKMFVGAEISMDLIKIPILPHQYIAYHCTNCIMNFAHELQQAVGAPAEVEP